MNNKDFATSIVSQATDVIQINNLTKDMWCRKPAGARRGPWLSGKYSFIDKRVWSESSACIYIRPE